MVCAASDEAEYIAVTRSPRNLRTSVSSENQFLLDGRSDSIVSRTNAPGLVHGSSFGLNTYLLAVHDSRRLQYAPRHGHHLRVHVDLEFLHVFIASVVGVVNLNGNRAGSYHGGEGLRIRGETPGKICPSIAPLLKG